MPNRSKFSYAAHLGPVLFLLLTPTPVMAYIGPGAGLTAIGSFLALVVALLVAFFGFVWFPLKRKLQKRKLSEANTVKTARADEK